MDLGEKLLIATLYHTFLTMTLYFLVKPGYQEKMPQTSILMVTYVNTYTEIKPAQHLEGVIAGELLFIIEKN